MIWVVMSCGYLVIFVFLGLTYLKKSLEILQFESEGTLQKSIYNGSKDSAVKLEEFIDSVFGSYSES